ncbi:alpha-(1-_3)-arabinofuranosyltransferase domain-containing protein [Ornithinimicrobium cryptoxanthini]|uniref:alpha-(1->3)-arabinofuranosyltransferase domain-containing protein n=1 Tax=Ornithinimicrobium cryptoxanthini TaxID=2934161 RepID=UPI002117F6B4|nr:alpha-(1->3)-arabinofuranosyltransferase family protein [Ornithinimicrobium cryptoxanthini]
MTAEPERPGTASSPWGARLVLGCLALTALMFRQAPGLVVPDTKLDLTADPLAFLGRSLHLWDPHGFLGQLQNQAYGYLLPVGPFHAFLIEFGLPAWVVQRLWWSVILCVAFIGTWKLARALGMGTPWTTYVAAFAYALTPRMLSEVTITSVEVWPMAMAPWVLLPLVSRAPLTWWGRIWRSALAVALVGGVNAVATGAVLVLPTLWFLTRRRTRETLLALLGWLAVVVVAMAWWLVPLLVMGAHSPPFLDWIESAAVSTLVAAPSEALRGTSHWLGYLITSSGPAWPGGRQYVDSGLLVAGSLVIAIVGLLALTRSRTPHRLFLAVGVGTGLVLVTAGHTGAVSGVLAAPVQDLLDGPLAALRNTHKFELVVRLPLVLLLASALTQLTRWGRQAQLHRALLPFVTACAVVLVAAPGLASTLPRAGGHEQIAPHWQQAAEWLDAQPGDGTVLVVPAASFADFTWGSTRDEPLQSLMERPFAVRDAVPLGGAGSTRWLDEIQRRLGSGDGGPDLAQALGRGGVGWVVVRNDLALTAHRTPQVAPHQALVGAGLERVADFGPPVGPAGESDSHTVRQRTIVPTPSVQIYAVPDPMTARLVPLADTMRLTGGPEDVPGLAGLAPAYLLEGSSATDSADLDGADLDGVDLDELGGTALSDGYRRRAVDFGRAADNLSGMMTPDQAMPDRRVNDYLVPGLGDRAPITWPAPVAAVTASSSASDADVLGRAGPGYDPWAALDGDPGTTWLSGDLGSPQGQWWQVDFTQPQDLGAHLTVRLSASAFFAPVQSWRVVTDAGSETTVVDPDSLDQELTVPEGPTTTLRIVAASVPAGTVTGAALAEVDLPGISPVAPDLQVRSASGPVDVVSLRAQQLGRSACLMLGQRPLCAGLQAQPMEEPAGLHRTVTLDTAASYAVHGQVMPVDGEAIEELLREPGQVEVSASSRDVFATYGRPDTVVDGDEGTGWVAGVLDSAPTLTLELPQERELTGLRVSSDYFLPASRPSELSVSLDGGEPMDLVIGAGGEVSWDPVEVSEVAVTFGRSFTVTTSDPLLPGPARGLPVGVSELTLLGDADFPVPDPDRALSLPCGSGPDVTVNGTTVRTQVTGTAREVLERDRLDWRPCGDAGSVSLDAAANQISAVATDRWVPVELTLTRDGFDAELAPATPLKLMRPSPAEVRVDVPARAEDSLVVLAQNFGSGWSAALVGDDGAPTPLEPLVVDGWQQGFVVPAGVAGTLEARFGPDRAYRAGLGVGLGALLLLVGAGLWRPGRQDGTRPALPQRAATLTLPARAALVGLFALALAGVWGLLLGVLAGVVLTLVARRTAGGSRSAVALAVPALTGVAGAALLAWAGPRPQGSDLAAVLPQLLLVLTTVLVLAAAAVTDLPALRAPRPGPRSAGGVSDGSRPDDPSP